MTWLKIPTGLAWPRIWTRDRSDLTIQPRRLLNTGNRRQKGGNWLFEANSIQFPSCSHAVETHKHSSGQDLNSRAWNVDEGNTGMTRWREESFLIVTRSVFISFGQIIHPWWQRCSIARNDSILYNDVNATRAVIGRCPWSVGVQIHGWLHGELVFFV